MTSGLFGCSPNGSELSNGHTLEYFSIRKNFGSKLLGPSHVFIFQVSSLACNRTFMSDVRVGSQILFLTENGNNINPTFNFFGNLHPECKLI